MAFAGLPSIMEDNSDKFGFLAEYMNDAKANDSDSGDSIFFTQKSPEYCDVTGNNDSFDTEHFQLDLGCSSYVSTPVVNQEMQNAFNADFQENLCGTVDIYRGVSDGQNSPYNPEVEDISWDEDELG